jgi:hypothetical protein
MPTILKLKRYAAGAALLVATAGLTGCYVAPAYGPRPYVYAAPGYAAPAYGYGYYHGPAYGYGYGNGYNRGDRW